MPTTGNSVEFRDADLLMRRIERENNARDEQTHLARDSRLWLWTRPRWAVRWLLWGTRGLWVCHRSCSRYEGPVPKARSPRSRSRCRCWSRKWASRDCPDHEQRLPGGLLRRVHRLLGNWCWSALVGWLSDFPGLGRKLGPEFNKNILSQFVIIIWWYLRLVFITYFNWS